MKCAVQNVVYHSFYFILNVYLYFFLFLYVFCFFIPPFIAVFWINFCFVMHFYFLLFLLCALIYLLFLFPYSFVLYLLLILLCFTFLSVYVVSFKYLCLNTSLGSGVTCNSCTRTACVWVMGMPESHGKGGGHSSTRSEGQQRGIGLTLTLWGL